MIKLTRRLSLIAEFSKDCRRVIDVGTDHGYLPVYFAQLDTTRYIAASDINQGPLNRAKISAEKYGVAERINFILSNGLDSCGDDYDTVIIAGMGGETAVDIIRRAEWTNSRSVRLVLQPQSKEDILFRYLCENGYEVEDCAVIKERQKFYIVLRVHGGGTVSKYRGQLCFTGEYILKRDEMVFKEYLEYQKEKISKAVSGMRSSNQSEGVRESEMLEQLKSIDSFLKELS